MFTYFDGNIVSTGIEYERTTFIIFFLRIDISYNYKQKRIFMYKFFEVSIIIIHFKIFL